MNSRARLIELDAETGKPVSGFGDNGIVNLLQGLAWPVDPKQYTNTSPPWSTRTHHPWKALPIASPTKRIRGDIRAFHARTGKLVWTFHTVPRKGEFGSDTWEDGANEFTGHTNVWAQ